MEFHIVHCNINVLDLEKSLQFYREALDLEVSRTKKAEDGFILTYLTDPSHQFEIELTWLRDRKDPYNLGDNESHIAFRVDDYSAAYKRHKDMDCVVYENQKMGIYFIVDPDGYWLEIVPNR